MFGAFKAWNDLDLEKDFKDPNFCPMPAMMFAFALLMVSWVSITFEGKMYIHLNVFFTRAIF